MGSRWGKEPKLSLTEIATFIACERINPLRAKRRAEQKSTYKWTRNRHLTKDRMLVKIRSIMPLVVQYMKDQLLETGELEFTKLGKLQIVNNPKKKSKIWHPTLKRIMPQNKYRKKILLKSDPMFVEFLNKDLKLSE
jgi:hypothetical protein